jgi:lambda repressor-like predicted transcriptional regulator
MNIQDQIIALLEKKPMSYEDLQREMGMRRDPLRSVLADMKAAKRVMYNQTDKVLEVYKVAML